MRQPHGLRAAAAAAAAEPLPAIGAAYQGGFFAGLISHTANGVPTHALIVAPASGGSTSALWKTILTTTPGTLSDFDGAANTAAMVTAGITDHPAAQFCTGLSIGGYSDWYLPARLELDLVYSNLKPTTELNNTSHGINAYSVPASTVNRTAGAPGQTSVAAFQTGGAQALADGTLGNFGVTSSTETNSSYHWSCRFNDGSQNPGTGKARKNVYALPVRAFRKVPFAGTEVPPGAPTIGTATATGQTTATVTFTAPVNNGGFAITSYIATSSPAGGSGTVSQAGSGTITVTGLTAGTAYTFTVKAVNIVGHSAASAPSNQITTNPPTVPGAPTIGTATATGITTATVTFTAPTNNGGATITSYIATSSPAGGSGTLSQAGSGTINITGLTSGTAYTFTVKAVNSIGQSASSAAGNQITTFAVPGAPTIGTATQVGPTEGVVFVRFTAPANSGGATILAYVATSSPAGGTGTVSQAGSGDITVTGLTVGTAYTFTVKAVNSMGESASSAASNQVTIVSPPPTYSITTTGLVLNLDAGNAASYPGSGTTWTDLTGSGSTMTLNNGPTYSTEVGGSIVFDGVDDWARTTSNGLGTGNIAHSLEMWVKFTDINVASRWWLAVIGSYEYCGQMLWIGSSITPTFGVWCGNVVAPNLLGANRWLHIVTTFNGSLYSSYVNSVAGPTANMSFNIGSPTFTIGLSTAQSVEKYFRGKIGIARIYNRALTAAEVTQNYTALRGRFSSPIVTSGLVLNLDAGDSASYPGTGTTWTDLSGNGNNATLTHGPTYSSANGGSIVFDGIDDYAIVNDAASIQFGTGDYTLETFVYANDISAGGNGRIIVSKGYTGIEFVFYANFLYMSPPNSNAFTGSAINTWYHLVSSRLSGVQTFYRNAVSIRSIAATANISFNGTPFLIGARPPVPPPGHFQGRIPVVRLYNRALTAAEVTQNFNALRGRYGL